MTAVAGSVRTRPSASAVSVVAFAIGAAPAALAGLDLAWLLITAALATLVVAPFLARRQVTAVAAIDGPERLTVSEGRTALVRAERRTHRAVRDVLVGVHRTVASPEEVARSPRVAWSAGASAGELQVPVRIPRRGRYDRLTWTLASSFPFGLVRSRREFEEEAEVTVYPRVFERSDKRLDAILHRLAHGLTEPLRRTPTRVGRGLPITVRAARHGDTMRDIAWKESARRDRWMAVDRAPTVQAAVEITLIRATFRRGPYGLRSFHAESSGPASTNRASMAFEWAVRTTATLAVRLLERGHEVTTRVVEWDPGAGLAAPAHDAASVTCRGRRSIDHLEFLTDVRADLPPPSTSNGEPRRPATRPVRVLIAPTIRTAAADAFDEPARGRDEGDTFAVGVDAVGRVFDIDLRAGGGAHR